MIWPLSRGVLAVYLTAVTNAWVSRRSFRRCVIFSLDTRLSTGMENSWKGFPVALDSRWFERRFVIRNGVVPGFGTGGLSWLLMILLLV